MSLREKKIAKKKESILRSAATVLSKKGYQKTTMDDIAAELLMTKGSLYYYFNNKHDLIYECQKLILKNAFRDLDEVRKREINSVKKLKEIIRTHVHYAINEKDIFNMIMRPNQTFTEEHVEIILEIRKEYSLIFDEVLQEGIGKGEFQAEDIKMVRMIILGATNWIQQWYSVGGEKSKEEIADTYANLLLKIVI